MNVYVYNFASLYSVTITDKIKDIVNNDPNGVISRDYTFLEDNLHITSSSEESNKYAYDIIKGLLAYGDDFTDFRRVFGVYEDRIIHYNSIPVDINYKHNIRDNEHFVTDGSDNVVSPWSIRPAQWLQIQGMMYVKPPIGGHLRDDPRNVFIESVSYTSPFDVSLNGMKLHTFPQLLMRYGLGGSSS